MTPMILSRGRSIIYGIMSVETLASNISALQEVYNSINEGLLFRAKDLFLI